MAGYYVTIIMGEGVSGCDWRLSNGMTGYVDGGTTYTWNRTSGRLYIYPDTKSGYTDPIYFSRTDGVHYAVTGPGGDNEIVFDKNKTGVLYATKSETPTPTSYILQYNGNHQTGGSTAAQFGDTSYIVRDCGYYKTGYTFDYWYTSGGAIYYPGNWITLSENTTLYAHWASNEFTVSYDANGGYGAPSDQTKYRGTNLTLSSVRPTWTGYTFLGWSTDSARNASVEYLAGGTYSTESAVTLYAVWQCTISFYSKDVFQSSQYARIGGRVTLPSLYDTDSETFEGWTGDDGERYQAGTRLTVMSSHRFDAVWIRKTFIITYNGNHASGGSTQRQTGAYTYTLRECGYYKTGYIFAYWYEDGKDTQYHPGDTITPDRDMTLLAFWKRKTYFYWHGDDAADDEYFSRGKRIDLAVTATGWNNLCTFVNEARSLAGLGQIAFSSVSAGERISANKYNIVSNAIKQIVTAGYGQITPITVSTNQEIRTDQFNGGSSLKAAINSVMDDLD